VALRGCVVGSSGSPGRRGAPGTVAARGSAANGTSGTAGTAWCQLVTPETARPRRQAGCGPQSRHILACQTPPISGRAGAGERVRSGLHSSTARPLAARLAAVAALEGAVRRGPAGCSKLQRTCSRPCSTCSALQLGQPGSRWQRCHVGHRARRNVTKAGDVLGAGGGRPLVEKSKGGSRAPLGSTARCGAHTRGAKKQREGGSAEIAPSSTPCAAVSLFDFSDVLPASTRERRSGSGPLWGHPARACEARRSLLSRLERVSAGRRA
jgi:hypothetical protein